MNDLLLPYDAFLRAIKQNIDNEHVFLLGAGASISSGVKPAEDCIWEWKKDIFVSKNPNLINQYKEFKAEAVRYSIQRWLDNEGCYPSLNDPDEYSKYALIAYPIDDIRKKYFENICRGKDPFIGYKLMCLLAQFGMIRSVFTTNFDGLIVKVAHQMGITPIEVTLDTADRIHRPASRTELLCVALHGDFKYGPLKNTGAELDAQNKTFVEALTHHLYDKHLIVFGYSGRDRSLMNSLKIAYAKRGSGLLFWCGHGDEIKPEVKELLLEARKAGRDAYFVPTDGFDNTLINLAKNCFENHQDFREKAEQTLKTTHGNEWVKTPFLMEVKHTNTIIRSNLFPISCPKEVFQFEITLKDGENPWQIIEGLTANTTITAAPLKQMVYAFGTLSEIHKVFGSSLKSEISRTPVTVEELKKGTIFKNLYRKTIIKGICQVHNLLTDGFKKIWKATDEKNMGVGSNIFKIFEATKVSLFFDDKYTYISLQPAFMLPNSEQVSKDTIREIARIYYYGLFRQKPNPNFDAFLDKWRKILFPGGAKLQFNYPYQSASGFKFSISADTMHVNLMKARSEYGLGVRQIY